MSNSDKLSSEVDTVIRELRNLKKELSEWKAEMQIKFELQKRIIKKVRDNVEAIRAQVNTLDFIDNTSFATINNLVATSVIRVEMLEAVRCLNGMLKLKFESFSELVKVQLLSQQKISLLLPMLRSEYW